MESYFISVLKTEYEEHLKGINQCARSSVQAEEGIQLKCNKFTQLKENFERYMLKFAYLFILQTLSVFCVCKLQNIS